MLYSSALLLVRRSRGVTYGMKGHWCVCAIVGLAARTGRAFVPTIGRSPPHEAAKNGMFRQRQRGRAMMVGRSRVTGAFDMSSLTVSQLRQALRQKKLKSTGNKQELLERLKGALRQAESEERAAMWQALDVEDDDTERMTVAPSSSASDLLDMMTQAAQQSPAPPQRSTPPSSPAATEAKTGLGHGVSEGVDDPNDPTMGGRLLDSLPDYEKSLKHVIAKRHVGWDGALEGYTLGDGTYVNVKEDPRLTDKDREEADVKLRKELERWQKEYPDKWEGFMRMCDEAVARKINSGAVEVEAGKDVDEIEKQVAEVERLEKERKALELPMARKMEAWESQLALAKEVTIIERPKKDGDTRVEEDVDDFEGLEMEAPAAAEEEEYVPIDAMYRDELDFTAADGQALKGYLVSSKVAQKFWRREERPVVLLLTDERGWRSVQTRKLADHMAFLTNHVFFVPDLYRGDAYDPLRGEAVEDWKARHPTMRLLQDARAAMQSLVNNYNATAGAMVGFGVGGGQVLSAAASGFIRTNAVVAMCPSGFDAQKVSAALDTPALIILGAADRGSGARRMWQDALTLMEKLRLKKALPYMIRVFKKCEQGFATRPKAGEESAAEDAVMLGTSWLEIQLRGGRAKLIQDARVC